MWRSKAKRARIRIPPRLHLSRHVLSMPQVSNPEHATALGYSPLNLGTHPGRWSAVGTTLDWILQRTKAYGRVGGPPHTEHDPERW
jgi:hypothetical protein